MTRASAFLAIAALTVPMAAHGTAIDQKTTLKNTCVALADARVTERPQFSRRDIFVATAEQARGNKQLVPEPYRPAVETWLERTAQAGGTGVVVMTRFGEEGKPPQVFDVCVALISGNRLEAELIDPAKP